MAWCEKKISGVLLDITGVLYDGGPSGGVAIPGSIDAVKRLKASGLPVRFCTNETTTTRKCLVEKLAKYACDVEAEVVGKPEKTFFHTAVQDMGISPDTCVMVGDDIVSDVGGAQKSGMRGVQVRTGKYRPEDESHPTVKADGVVDDLSQAVDLILSGLSK